MFSRDIDKEFAKKNLSSKSFWGRICLSKQKCNMFLSVQTNFSLLIMNGFSIWTHFWNPHVTMDQLNLFSGDIDKVFGKTPYFLNHFWVVFVCPNKNVTFVCPSVCLSVRPNKFFSFDYEWIFNPNTFLKSSCNNGPIEIVLGDINKKFGKNNPIFKIIFG